MYMLPFLISKRVCIILLVFVFIFFTIFMYNMTTLSYFFVQLPRLQPNEYLLNHRIEFCHCDRLIVSRPKVMMIWNSTCSPSADLRGPYQKVLSFSFYGDVSSHYFKGIETNANSIAKLYPGWVMRLYHNIDRKNEMATKALCRILCKYGHVDECYVDDLPPPIGSSASEFLGSVWRFMVLGDPLVDILISRDLDAVLGQREVDAVQQWLNSNFSWHIMRDHVGHNLVMLAGMWGVKNGKDLSLMTALRSTILHVPKRKHKQFDQDILRTVVWPVAMNDMLAHDSYTCEIFNNTTPYPTKRVRGFFIGNYHGETSYKACPMKCRPLNHQDWEYC